MLDLICAGIALVDSIIRGFDPHPISASGYLAASGSLNVGGEAVNQSMAAASDSGTRFITNSPLSLMMSCECLLGVMLTYVRGGSELMTPVQAMVIMLSVPSSRLPQLTITAGRGASMAPGLKLFLGISFPISFR